MKTFKSFDEVVDFAINAEIEAVNFYRILADFVEKPEMAEVLSGLAFQESEHKTKLAPVPMSFSCPLCRFRRLIFRARFGDTNCQIALERTVQLETSGLRRKTDKNIVQNIL